MSDPSTAAPTENLSRGLKNRHLQLIAIGGAIGTGLFFGSGKLTHVVGPGLLVVYAVIGFFLFFVMRALGELLLSNLNYKTFGDIAKDNIGPWAGFMVSWNYWFSWVVGCVADLVAITAYVQYFWPSVPVWLPALLTAVGLIALNLQPVKAFGETEFWFAIIKIVAILALILVGIVLILRGYENGDGTKAAVSNLWSHGGIFPTGLTGFMLGFQLAIFSFIGMELVGTTAAETENPHRNLPRAINSILLRIVIFYLGSLSVIMMVTPWDHIDPEQSPFTTMFGNAGFAGAAFVVNLVVLTSAASSANSGVYSATRMAFGLSKDGHAPSALNMTTRRGVPMKAVFFTTVFLFAAIPLLLGGDALTQAFTVVSSICSADILFTWGSIVVSYILYRRRHPDVHRASGFKMPLSRIAPWFVLAFFVFIAFTLTLSEDTRIAAYLSPLWFIFLAVAWQFVKRRLIRQKRPLTAEIPQVSPHEVRTHFENKEQD
ncbi:MULTISPECIES: amino acid permease [Kocuria]|uniref:amino acid permease n=1 Tax=Kocuria TaxID=57493 RepID=UPI0006601304|nr:MULTISPECIES: amino acid permease [Kocuria]MCT1367713.1 amino acid permease [Rothia sp. p3-SID1597]RUQ20317.1 amino acid permease [Kocuria sp. HSID16901]